MALTDVKIRNAKPKAKRYRLTDTHGLSVEITPKNNRFWRYRYRIGGRENLFAAGDWCVAPIGETAEQAATRQEAGRMTLAEARAARVIWRDQVKSGQHPRLVRLAQQLAAATSGADTFKAVAEEFIERRGGTWGSSHRWHFKRFMEKDAYPHIGGLPITSLRANHLLAVLKRVEEREAHSVAHLGRGYLGQVFRYAVATQKAAANPIPDLRGALVKVDTKHHPTLTKREMGPFLRAMRKAQPDRKTEIAVLLLLYTMTRTIELRTGWWSEMDIRHALWRIPPERMKMKLPHIVPLSRQAVKLVKELRALTYRGPESPLFPNARDPKKSMGSSTIGRVFERAGYTGILSPHGFRGTASTLLREEGFDGRLIELQLAHMDRNASRRAYDHAELLGPRRKMLQAWADMVEAAERSQRR